MNPFKPGDRVICLAASGYHFTKGKVYTIIEYEPPLKADLSNYTWPAYVIVEDDTGKRAHCHASRFVSLDKELLR